MEEQKLLKRKRKYAEESNYKLLGETCQKLGNFYHQECEYKKALHEYKLEAKAFDKAKDKMGVGRANRMIGEMYMLLDDFVKALMHEALYYETAKEENNKIEQQRALATVGRAYLLQGQGSDDAEKAIESLKLAEKSFLKSLLICSKLSGEVPKIEQADMQARLFLNLGVTKEYQNFLQDAVDYIEKAINVCKINDLNELLHQCHLAIASLYNLKIKDSGKALKVLNTALEIASRLDNSKVKLCETYIVKADAMIRMGDYQSAKASLKKAFKIKTPVESDRATIEDRLKVLIAVCRIEDQLITTEDLQKKKMLYERMGDGSCKLHNYSKAIEYYLKMLDCAQLKGDSGRDLLPIYVSLYQTYKDTEEYDKSLEYLWMEHKLIEDEPQESFNTLINIAEVLELKKESFWEIEQIYSRAIADAKKLRDKKLESIGVKKLVELLKANGMAVMAEEEEKKAIKRGIDLKSVDSEEESDEHNTPDVGNDVLLEDMSDSEVEMEERRVVEAPRQARKRGTSFALKKNAKGETSLQTACISGNLTLVQKLLEQGHPVNVRDYAGWTPLHEACIHGHRRIVELLLDDGAKINDKGGTGCDGITPLYDACSNGNLEVVELLLERGANSTALTDFGETPLTALEKWFGKFGRKLSDSDKVFYTSIKDKLAVNLERAGIKTVEMNTSNEKIQYAEVDSSSQALIEDEIEIEIDVAPANRSFRMNRSNRLSSATSKVGKLRNCLSSDSEEDLVTRDAQTTPTCSYGNRKEINLASGSRKITRIVSSESSDDEILGGVESYRNAINDLKKKKIPQIKEIKKSEKRFAHLGMSDVDDDDWLIDDLGPSKKRAKTVSESFSPAKIQPISDEIINSTIIPLTYSSSSDDENRNPDAFNILKSNVSKAFRKNKSKTRFNLKTPSQNSLKSQSSLLEAGFSVSLKSPIPVEDDVEFTSAFFNTPTKMSPVKSSFVRPSPMKTISPQQNVFKVRIEGDTISIKATPDEIDSKTVGWLANEAALKYSLFNGQKPSLRLWGEDGNLCETNEPLSSLLKTKNFIDTIVLEWEEVTLQERFDIVCKEMDFEIDTDLRSSLEDATATNIFKLKKGVLSYNKIKLKLLFRTLKNRKSLKELHLTMNMIDDDDIKYLAEILPTLSGLNLLNLRSNMITSDGIPYLSTLSSTFSPRPLNELVELDLSFNPLFDNSLPDLFNFCNNLPKLKILRLNSCNITNIMIDNHPLSLEKCIELNMNGNNLNNRSLDYIFEKLSAQNIEKLDCKIMPEFNIKRLARFYKEKNEYALQTLDLSNCDLKDADVLEILYAINKCSNLEVIDLSCNIQLTSLALAYLLKHSCNFRLKTVNLNCCPGVVSSLDDDFSKLIDFNLESISKFPKSILLSCLSVQVRDCKLSVVRQLWEKIWGEVARIEVDRLSIILCK